MLTFLAFGVWAFLYGEAGRPRPFYCIVGYIVIVEVYFLDGSYVGYGVLIGCYILSGFWVWALGLGYGYCGCCSFLL